MSLKNQEWKFTAVNNGAPPILLGGDYMLQISGTFVATIAWQRSLDGGVSWTTVAEYTAVGAWKGEDPEGAHYRPAVTSYTSGSVKVRAGQ